MSRPSHRSGFTPARASSVGIVCIQCAQKISINMAAKVSEEFSIQCSKYGKRTFYRIKDLKTLEAS
jgi:hypothetical protein